MQVLKEGGVYMKNKKTEQLLLNAAEKLVGHNVNSACCWYFYQPPLSQKMVKKFKK